MKKILVFVAAFSLLGACGESPKKEQTIETKNEEVKVAYFGEKIDENNAVEASKLIEMMDGNDSLRIKLSGTIKEVCKVKGCWMTMPIGESDMRIGFKDYAFFVPKDADGKVAIIEGVAYRDTTSVDMLRHYAEDAGESEESIAAITEPEVSISFEASGVIIK